ncbi:Uncharacterised protein [Serratia fonticola]|uniref:Uncharacterized protein n=1 Tax=Serratia fonticola TaxID=47917 RepID=A0A4U9U3E7_SERFO|nr:Uncharacterised protein [Serratia fonticola]
MTLYALNDYYIDVPISDVAKYNMILAYKMGGEMLKVRDFGPLFLIYPAMPGARSSILRCITRALSGRSTGSSLNEVSSGSKTVADWLFRPFLPPYSYSPQR